VEILRRAWESFVARDESGLEIRIRHAHDRAQALPFAGGADE
jgi:hypothetical protein